MRISDLSNLSELVTDRNAVYMEYIGVEVQRCGCFTMISNKFELTTPFFGKDSEEIAHTMDGKAAYLHIREDDFHPMGDVKCTLYNIQSVKCVGEKIKLELLTHRTNRPKDDLQNEADKISNTRFRFVWQNFVVGTSYDLIMVRVKD